MGSLLRGRAWAASRTKSSLHPGLGCTGGDEATWRGRWWPEGCPSAYAEVLVRRLGHSGGQGDHPVTLLQHEAGLTPAQLDYTRGISFGALCKGYRSPFFF